MLTSESSVRAPTGRVIVIGDVHGCYDELLELLSAVGLGVGDRVIFVGDLVDRGPRPRECVELAMRHQAVMGNHEESTLRRRLREKTTLAPHHRNTVEALEQPHFDWMEQLPLYLELPEHNAVVVHAGVVPAVSMSRQKPFFLLHGQHVRPPEARGRSAWQPTSETWHPNKAPAEAVFWADAYEQEAKTAPEELWSGDRPLVLYGHSVFDRPYIQDYSIGLDTGACFGLQLTAVELPSRRIYQVPARAQHYPSRVNKVALPSGALVYS